MCNFIQIELKIMIDVLSHLSLTLFELPSSGVSQTGTYIAIDRCLQQAEEGVVNVWGTVYQMRTERVNMVETLVRLSACNV